MLCIVLNEKNCHNLFYLEFLIILLSRSVKCCFGISEIYTSLLINHVQNLFRYLLVFRLVGTSKYKWDFIHLRFSPSILLIWLSYFTVFLDSPLGNTDNKTNEESGSFCDIGVCVPGTHKLLGHPTAALSGILDVVCGKHDGKLSHNFYCGFWSSSTFAYVLSSVQPLLHWCRYFFCHFTEDDLWLIQKAKNHLL